MSESKQRKRLEKAEAELLVVLQRHSVAIDDDGVSCVQALLVELDAVETARRELGSLPPAVDAYVQEAQTILATPDENQRLPQAVYWEKSPGGRTRVKLVSLIDEGRDFLAQLALDSAAARGYGLRFCAFPADTWQERLTAISARERRSAKQVAEDLANSTINLAVLPQGFSLLRVPKMTDESMVAGCVAGTLRLLDGLVASRGTARKSSGVLRISFDGYDDDPREVWDVQENRWFIEAVDHFAPWWFWVASPSDAMIWTGALFSTAPTVVNENQNVAFPVNKQVMKQALRISVFEVLDVLRAVGVDPKEAGVLEHTEDMMGAMVASANFAEERFAELERGETKPEASPELTSSPASAAAQKPEPEPEPSAKPSSSAFFDMNLLDLATAPGGVEVDFDLVQITDAAAFGKIAEHTMKELVLSAGKEVETKTQAWSREDGSLLVRQESPLLEVTVPSGGWRLLTQAQMSEIEQTVERRGQDPKLLKELAGYAEKMKRGVHRRNIDFSQVIARSSLAVCVFDKSGSALRLLRQIVGAKEAVAAEVDKWLSADRSYFIVLVERSKGIHTAIAKDQAHLLTQVLPNLLVGAKSRESMLLLTRMEPGTDADIVGWWKENGGLTFMEVVEES